MFHQKSEELSTDGRKKILLKVFYEESYDNKLLYKTDFKATWLYLFGYKISKSPIRCYFF